MFSSVLNILLDLLLVIQWDLGVYGAAAGTLVSQICASVLCVIYARKKAAVLKAVHGRIPDRQRNFRKNHPVQLGYGDAERLRYQYRKAFDSELC